MTVTCTLMKKWGEITSNDKKIPIYLERNNREWEQYCKTMSNLKHFDGHDAVKLLVDLKVVHVLSYDCQVGQILLPAQRPQGKGQNIKSMFTQVRKQNRDRYCHRTCTVPQ